MVKKCPFFGVSLCSLMEVYIYGLYGKKKRMVKASIGR
jgi:hypothetical protein